MTHKTLIVLSLVLIAAVLSIAHLLRRNEPPPRDERRRQLEKAIEKYRLQGYLGSGRIGYLLNFGDHQLQLDEIFLQNCLELLRDKYGKTFTHINFNAPVEESSINLYFIDKDPEGLFTEFKNNCAYIGHKNIIICDVHYIAELGTDPISVTEEDVAEIKKYDPTYTREHLDRTLKSLDKNTWFWIIGHEIGHLALDHRGRHFTFNDDGNEYLIRNFDGKGSSEELAADNFAIEAIGEELSSYFYFGLVGLINRMGNQLLKQQGHSRSLMENENSIFLKSSSITHPPMFLRAVDLQIAMTQKYRELDTTKYYDRIRKQIVIR